MGVMPSRRTLGRLLAGLVGIEWFVLLLFGGLGVFFGPMAWIAAGIGGSRPRAALILLGLPVVFLIVSWIPIVFDRTANLSLADAGVILGVLTLPAVVAAALIAAPARSPRPPAKAD
jgi:hypothetical protein